MLPMKRVIFLLWVLSLAAWCAAQDGKAKSSTARPDFSGNWILDHSKSSLGPLERVLANAEVTLVIAHKEPELKISRKASVNGREQSQILTYYSDARGETNPAVFGSAEMKTKTKWDKSKLVSDASTSINTRRGDTIHIDTSERREISSDGNTLTITVSISGAPQGLQVIKQVYSRAQ
jgi:hypothetical protein